MDYPEAVAAMEARVAAIAAGTEAEAVWLVEHPPLYTAGTSADASDLLAPTAFRSIRTGRGGQYTYHGPGQRVAYVMLDLGRRGPDLRGFVRSLEEWIIRTLAALRRHRRAARRAGRRLGRHPAGYDKIAAIGIRVRRWVSFHGIAINVDPDLEHFTGIVPCGVRGSGVTSLRRARHRRHHGGGRHGAPPRVRGGVRSDRHAVGSTLNPLGNGPS